MALQLPYGSLKEVLRPQVALGRLLSVEIQASEHMRFGSYGFWVIKSAD
jgi:hypothetical protein